MRCAAWWGRLALGTFAVLWLAVPAPAQGPKPGGANPAPTIDPAFQAQIDAAIDRGVAYLRGQQQKSGAFPGGQMGSTALAGLALLESGVSPSDDAVKRAAVYVRDKALREEFCYSLSTAILFLDRLGDPRDTPLIQALAVRLLEAQNRQPKGGGWSYSTGRVVPPAEVEALRAALKNGPASGKKKPLTPDDLPRTTRERIARAYAGLGTKAPVDLSNTQFAMLALWVARRHGIPVGPAFAATEARLRRTQFANGGWGYLQGRLTGRPELDADYAPTAQMTYCGLMLMAMAHAVADDPKQGRQAMDQDPAIHRALLLIVPTVGAPAGDLTKVPAIKEGPHTKTYFALWALERMAVLFDLKRIGGRDWYRWGAEILIKNQQGGSWRGAYASYCADTCFGLLFLKRANLAVDLTQTVKSKLINSNLLSNIESEGAKTKSDLVAPPKKKSGKQSWAPPTAVPGLPPYPSLTLPARRPLSTFVLIPSRLSGPRRS